MAWDAWLLSFGHLLLLSLPVLGRLDMIARSLTLWNGRLRRRVWNCGNAWLSNGKGDIREVWRIICSGCYLCDCNNCILYLLASFCGDSLLGWWCSHLQHSWHDGNLYQLLSLCDVRKEIVGSCVAPVSTEQLQLPQLHACSGFTSRLFRRLGGKSIEKK